MNFGYLVTGLLELENKRRPNKYRSLKTGWKNGVNGSLWIEITTTCVLATVPLGCTLCVSFLAWNVLYCNIAPLYCCLKLVSPLSGKRPQAVVDNILMRNTLCRFQLYQTGTEQFNMKPAKGIAFLQDHGLLSVPLDAGEVVQFIKENPKLDKKMIGEYVSQRKNATVLEAFQK